MRFWTQLSAGGIILVASCGPIGNTVKIIKGDGQTQPTALFTAADAAGTWQVRCKPHHAAEGTFTSTITLTLAQDKMTREALYFYDPDCLTPVLTTKQTGTFVIGDVSLGGVRNVVISNLSTVDTPHTNDVAASLNKDATCAMKTWAVGMAQDVSLSSICNTLTTDAGLAVNAVQVILGSPSQLSLLHQDGNNLSFSSGDQYQK